MNELDLKSSQVPVRLNYSEVVETLKLRFRKVSETVTDEDRQSIKRYQEYILNRIQSEDSEPTIAQCGADKGKV